MTKDSSAKVVLSIAGSDSSAGAGIAADVKTGGAFGVFTATAITAVTAQSPAGVDDIFALTPEQLLAQIDSVTNALPIHAIKIGMLCNGAQLETLVAFLTTLKTTQPDLPVVFDPVLAATAGGTLWQAGLAPICDQLMPLCTLITPNTLEAAKLLNTPPAQSYEAQQEHALALLKFGPQASLVKGGHNTTPLATDYLAVNQKGGSPAVQPFSNARIECNHSHGSGCTLATAIAAGLAQGLELPQAVAAAKSYVHGALQHSARLNLAKTNGPLHHFYTYW